jgi:proteasome lid subunit RPN8/RPN11
MVVRVSRAALERMQAEAAAAAPEECCGLLLGGPVIDEARPVANVAPNRRRRFEIDPQALVDALRGARQGGPEVLGYYHSHPAGPPEPSVTDRSFAAGDGKVWAIVADDGVTFWRDDGHRFAPLSYVVEDR